MDKLATRSTRDVQALHALVTQELHPVLPRQRVLWEVYAGRNRAATIAEALNMQTRVFGYHTSWNFWLKEHRTSFLQLVGEEQLDEVLFAQTRGPWSQMQNLAARTHERRERLMALRKWHHATHLQFVRKGSMKQAAEERHAHAEQPTTALSWQTPALKTLPGHRAQFHQLRIWSCLPCLDEDGQWRLVNYHDLDVKERRCLSNESAARSDAHTLSPGRFNAWMVRPPDGLHGDVGHPCHCLSDP